MTAGERKPVEPPPPGPIQGVAPEPLDLAGILEKAPARRAAVLDIGRLDFGKLGLGEIVDLSTAAGIDPGTLGQELRSKDTARKIRVAVALAWILARRSEPDLTIEDVRTWSLEVRGSAAKNPTVRPPRNRAERRSTSSRSPERSGSRRPRPAG
jgi:hypothetical protein